MVSAIPLVTVLTAVRDGEAYVDAAIASIVAQTFDAFEYILINDGSTDRTPAILEEWAGRDARIRVLHNARSLNAAGALNRGLAEAHGVYVAILDHDDLAYPTRLAEQVAFLEANPRVAVVGAQVMSIDANGQEQRVLSFPTAPAIAQWRIFFHTPVLHSAAMMRRALVEQVGRYSVAMWTATDYELFARLARVGEITNLPTTLVAYRQSPNQLSTAHNRIQMGQVLLFLQALILARFGFDKRHLPALTACYYGVRGLALSDEAGLDAAGGFLDELYQAYVTLTPLGEGDRQLITEDCAWNFLLLAWIHRRTYRAASRRLLARAVALDPQLWQRAKTWAILRKLRSKAT